LRHNGRMIRHDLARKADAATVPIHSVAASI
jgi:hypothetical protein